MGLLPEVPWTDLSRPSSQLSLLYNGDASDDAMPMPYPYKLLHEYYAEERRTLFSLDRSSLMPKSNACKRLYIDAYIENQCNAHLVRAEWRQGANSGLYPPPSLQALLRILLVPGISLEKKHLIFVYLFLDLNAVLEEERHRRVVQNLIKFPAVFKIDSALIRTTQAFWNLDHKQYEVITIIIKEKKLYPTKAKRYFL